MPIADAANAIGLVAVVLICGAIFIGIVTFLLHKVWPGIKTQNQRLKERDSYYSPYFHKWIPKRSQATGAKTGRRKHNDDR